MPPPDDLTTIPSKQYKFTSRLISTGQLLTQDRFVTTLEERGWQVLGSGQNGDPSGSAWTEACALDKRGHNEGWKLARSVEAEVRDLVSRIGALVKAGWTEIIVVTDHGWLLLPSGLPKIELLLRSIGMEPEKLTPRARDLMLLRMVPFVERNFNMVELGPRGTGKSHLFQQVSPYAHLISGGKATVASMFVNNASGQRGLVCQYDVVCFDEISGVSFDQKDGVNIMKGYMESGEFSRGKESIRADGGIVMVGNFDVDVQHQQRVGHLFGPLPPEMRHDPAFMDRIHAYLPGWDLPKVSLDLLTDRFGLVSDFLSECWDQLRRQSRQNLFQGRIHLGGALSGRDTTGVQKTLSGLIKLVSPNPDIPVPDEVLEWALRIALECRRRVKEQQKRIGSAEFRNTQFSYSMGDDGGGEVRGNPGAIQREQHW